MGLTHFPHGVSSFGMPMIGSGPYLTTGKVFFVDSGSTKAADSTAHGKDPDRPFATIDFAIGQCTANNGDTIFAMPGHVETLDAAGELTFDVAGVTLIGIGHGNTRPRILQDAVAADVDITAADVVIRNIVFRASIADITHGVDISAAADRLWLDQCEWEDEAVNLNFLIYLNVAAGADGLKITNCRAISPDANNEEFALIAGDLSNLTMVGNFIKLGNTDESVVQIDGSGSLFHCLIAHNFISRPGLADADANAFFLSGQTDNSGIVAYNVFEANDATAALGIDLTGAALFENYLISENDLQGILIPAAT